MKLIQKKCPNCGASLEFNNKDTSCKCNYCNTTFEIQKENNDIYNLTPAAKIGITSSIIITIITFIIVIIIFIIVCIGIFNNNKDNKDNNIINEIKEKNEQDKNLLDNIDDISNNKYKELDTNALFIISHDAEGIKDTNSNYLIDGKASLEHIYLLSKENSNMLITVYKATYYNFFNTISRYTIYIPIVYENITKSLNNITNGKIKAPKYYFNKEETIYYNGYSSIEEINNKLIESNTNE